MSQDPPYKPSPGHSTTLWNPASRARSNKTSHARQHGRTVRLRWVPRHVGIQSNEQVDQLAKLGTQKDRPPGRSPGPQLWLSFYSHQPRRASLRQGWWVFATPTPTTTTTTRFGRGNHRQLTTYRICVSNVGPYKGSAILLAFILTGWVLGRTALVWAFFYSIFYSEIRKGFSGQQHLAIGLYFSWPGGPWLALCTWVGPIYVTRPGLVLCELHAYRCKLPCLLCWSGPQKGIKFNLGLDTGAHPGIPGSRVQGFRVLEKVGP